MTWNNKKGTYKKSCKCLCFVWLTNVNKSGRWEEHLFH